MNITSSTITKIMVQTIAFLVQLHSKIPYNGIELTAQIIRFLWPIQFCDHVYFSKPVPLASATSRRASDRVCKTASKV